MENDNLDNRKTGMDSVVHFVGRRRRYVVARLDIFGRFDLCALSGPIRGSHTLGVDRSAVELDHDQEIRFEGAVAGKLKSNYVNVKTRRDKKRNKERVRQQKIKRINSKSFSFSR